MKGQAMRKAIVAVTIVVLGSVAWAQSTQPEDDSKSLSEYSKNVLVVLSRNLREKVSRLESKNEKLASKVESLKAKNQKLRATVKNIKSRHKQREGDKAEADGKRKGDGSSGSFDDNADFPTRNASLRNLEFGGVEVIGEIKNNTSRNYRVTSFTMSAFDAKGRLVGTATINVTNFASGSVKSFEALFPNLSASQFERYKIQFEGSI